MAVDVLREHGVIVYPTDSCYALGCLLGAKEAMERIQRIRQTDKHHFFTLVCRDLSEIATYARVTDWAYRLLREQRCRGQEDRSSQECDSLHRSFSFASCNSTTEFTENTEQHEPL